MQWEGWGAVETSFDISDIAASLFQGSWFLVETVGRLCHHSHHFLNNRLNIFVVV